MQVIIISIGQVKQLAQVATHYLKRLHPLLKLTEIVIKDSTPQKETDQLTGHLNKHPKEQIFLLDERGAEYTSVHFSEMLTKKAEEGNPIVFVVGGANGFDTLIKQTYNSIRLSTMTFPHEIAFVLLLEQLYRARMIQTGREYHKD